jgi:hypothetical protein
MVKRTIQILGLTALILGVTYFVIDQTRSIYCLSNEKCITVWKRVGGSCYLVPERYYGILKPTEYIKTENSNSLTILYDANSKYDFIILNDYGKRLEVITSDTKIKYFTYEERDDFIKKYFINNRIKPRLKYLQIDIGENLAVVNGEIK